MGEEWVMKKFLLGFLIVFMGTNLVFADSTSPTENCTITASGERICDLSTVLMTNPVMTELMKQTVNYVGDRVLTKIGLPATITTTPNTYVAPTTTTTTVTTTPVTTTTATTTEPQEEMIPL